MQADLFATNVDFRDDLVRNIPGIRKSQSLFDDLSPEMKQELIDRTLILGEVRRFAPAEPGGTDVELRSSSMPAWSASRTTDGFRTLFYRASREGAQLAVETAYHPYELPRPPAMRNILDALSGEPVGAWLDTGHVSAQSHLGVANQASWIDAVRGRWLGAHLHDAVGLRDHLVAGIGTVDFAPALAALPGAHVLLTGDRPAWSLARASRHAGGAAFRFVPVSRLREAVQASGARAIVLCGNTRGLPVAGVVGGSPRG